ncbi:DUF4129 domain-containing protein [Natrinema amylolyticum]|uniref:DUF4129 domain-containing protein n=1 Tax=Natrinema amylolyticum TaxID=2878679 RepID=UPI001CFAC478|nr:DUF4129 domain-containing protein [Natrinema amylolyticum]
MSDATPDESDDVDGGADYRQVSFIVLAALALVLAAAFTPGMTGGSESDSSPGFDVDWDGILPDIDFTPDTDGNTDVDRPEDGGGSDGEPGDGPGGDFDWRRLLEWLNLDRGDDDIEPPTETEEPQCVIMLDRDPVPGSQLTATVRYEGEPLAETPVWFDEQRVGETDEMGRVTGEVPYVEELVIRVGAGTDATCRAGTSTSLTSSMTTEAASQQSDDNRQSDVDARQSGETETEIGAVPSVSRSMPSAAGTTSAAVTTSAAATTSATSTVSSAATASTASAVSPVSSAPVLASSVTPVANTQDEATGNATGTHAVDGEVEINVDGDPYPGETITVGAAVEDVPMREATVSVDGTAVGETDDEGRAAVTVPDDGTDAFEVEVARGDFAGTTTVDILLLEAAFSPDGIAPVPGSPGAVEATINGEPVAGAAVTVDGEAVGTTDADGRLATGLPRDPTATVTVGTERQTASVSLVSAYGGPALLFSSLVAGLAVLSSRRYGRHGPIAVLGGTAALAAVLIVEAFYGQRAGIAALGGVCLLGLGIGLSRSERSLPAPSVRDRPSSRDWLDRFTSRFVALAMGVVDRLEVLLERAHALAGVVSEWLRSLPRSGRELWTRFAAWLGTLPGRIRSGLGAALATARTLPIRAVAVGIAAIPLIAGGYAVDDVRGAILVTVALAVAGAVVFRSDEEDAETDARDRGTEPDADAATAREPSPETDGIRSFRELWRAFARRVAPRRWRTRTPGEIERRALSEGYPREPVRELTTLFREVEYGGRSRSPSRRERAAEAYDAVERTRANVTEADETVTEADETRTDEMKADATDADGTEAAERDGDGTRSASPTVPIREPEPDTEEEP